MRARRLQGTRHGLRPERSAVALLLALLCGTSAGSPESAGEAAEVDLSPLTRQIQRLVERDEVVGAELLIVRAGETLLHEAFGLADREASRPMRTGTLFGIKSMTKPWVGTAVQILIDDGALRPDTPVASVLEAWDREDKRGVTVEHLLTHRSGLPLSLPDPDRTLGTFSSALDVACAAAELPLKFEPGNGYSYSDAGTDTLAGIVEQVSGQALGAFLRERVFGPLEMHDAFVGPWPEELRDREMATLYRRGGDGTWEPVWDYMTRGSTFYEYALGSQSGFCTAVDYARFLASWCGRGELLTQEAIRRATTAGTVVARPSSILGHVVAYGRLWVLWYDRSVVVGDAGTTLESLREELSDERPAVLGHSGYDGTAAWAWPAEELVVVYLTQCMELESLDLVSSTVDALLVNPPGARPVEPAELERCVGRYGIRWDGTTETVLTLELRDEALWVSWPGQEPIRLEPPDRKDRWHLAGDVERDLEYRAISFEPRDGKAAGLVWHQTSYAVPAERLPD